MEFVLGGLGACCAGFFTNPLEVVKTRMQLQGELQARGKYFVNYRNVFHAARTIAKVDGILALQKGLVPALYYQFVMNGIRLGAYQVITNYGFITDKEGHTIVSHSFEAGAFAGCLGAFCGSPLYMIKTHLQAQAAKNIAVGHQHNHDGFHSAFIKIFKESGMKGLWRGVSGALARVAVGSAIQLATFSTSIELVKEISIFESNHLLSLFAASMLSGVTIVAGMTPFDVVSTRLYNQPVTTTGKGKLYSGFTDCVIKIFRNEGAWGFYKGWAASLFRLGPHTVLCLVFWQELRDWHKHMKEQ